MHMTVEEFLNLHWEDEGDPLIEPPWNSPVLADPSFLFPDETPGRVWMLFAHTVWGIRRYESKDGLCWRDKGMVVRHAMRPFSRPVPGGFILLYEAYQPFAVVKQLLAHPPRWQSYISMKTSRDLYYWTDAGRVLLPTMDWMRDRAWGNGSSYDESVSNPCLVELRDRAWRLYYSASLAYIPDCGFSEPRYIGVANGSSPFGPFRASSKPIINPSDDWMPGVVSAGAIKVITLENGYIGIQNKIYIGKDKLSRSALFLLSSEDGLVWFPALMEPLLAPSSGWRSSHIYACDCRRANDGTWYLYYNARDGWYKTKGRERIGRLVGRV